MRDYLNIAGKLLKLIPNNDTDGTCSLAVADQSNIFTGTAAGGTTTTLLDVDKNFEADSVKGRMIRFVLNSIEFVRKITACTGSQVTFGATIPDIGASLASGNIPMTTGPIPFTGGQDGLPVVAGTKYTIFP